MVMLMSRTRVPKCKPKARHNSIDRRLRPKRLSSQLLKLRVRSLNLSFLYLNRTRTDSKQRKLSNLVVWSSLGRLISLQLIRMWMQKTLLTNGVLLK